MKIQAEVSLYALGEADLLPSIREFVRGLEQPGLEIEFGPMSSLLTGEHDLVFPALQQAYEAAARRGRRVLLVKILNEPRATSASQTQ